MLESCSLLAKSRGAWQQVSSERGTLSGPSLGKPAQSRLEIVVSRLFPLGQLHLCGFVTLQSDARGREVISPGVCAALKPSSFPLDSGGRISDSPFSAFCSPDLPTSKQSGRLLFSPSSVLHCISTFCPGPVPVQCGSPVKSVK